MITRLLELREAVDLFVLAAINDSSLPVKEREQLQDDQLSPNYRLGGASDLKGAIGTVLLHDQGPTGKYE
jgi:hypothetical protein